MRTPPLLRVRPHILPQAAMRLWSSIPSSPTVPLRCSFEAPRREAAEEVGYWTGQQSCYLRNPISVRLGSQGSYRAGPLILHPGSF